MSASLLFFLIGLTAGYLVMRPLATVVHELGHVIALRLLGMRGEMRVFLGSLGDGKRSWRFQTSSITWAIHPSILLMRGGLTDYSAPISSPKLAAVALAGPIASFSLAVGAGFAMFGSSFGPVRAVLLLACLLATMDGLLALFHRYEPILLSNDHITANDGQVLAWYLKFRGHTTAYLHARWLFEKDRYAEAATAIAALVAAGLHEKLLYEYWIYALLMQRQPADALVVHAMMAERHTLDAYDDCLLALALEQTGEEAAADAALAAAIARAPGHHEALNHRAYRAMRAAQWEVAASSLNRALKTQPDFAAALNNRGALHLGRLDIAAAEADILAALRQDHENPFIHRNLALLAMLKGDAEASKSHLESARLLGLREGDGL